MGRTWLCLCAILVGCVKPSSVSCDDGRVCGQSLLCDNVNHLCVPGEQRDACGTLQDGDKCAWGDNVGLCTAGTCLASCGDGAANVAGEECDDGNAASADGCSADCALEAPQWQQWTSAWEPREGHDAVFDTSRATLFVFGGTNEHGDVPFAWQRARGTNHDAWAPIAVAPPRQLAAAAYDSVRHVIVMFGGRSGITPSAETWEFDGVAWTKRTLAVSPPARSGAAMAFDQARSKIVMFGGATDTTTLTTFGDTWEYDGTTWTQIDPSQSPEKRVWSTLTYDSKRQKSVLFAGCDNNAALADTWEYASGSWTPVTVTPSPTARCGAAAADLPNVGVVIHGGFVGAAVDANDTWTFDGTAWTQVVTTTTPPARRYAALAFDATGGKLTLVGGTSGTDVAQNDVWELDYTSPTNAQWVERDPGFSPVPRIAPLVRVPTKKAVLAFGGNTPHLENDTWMFGRGTQDLEWREQTSAISPPARFFSTLVYDSKRERVVLFGGLTAFGDFLDDTWEWKDFSWSQATPTTKPSARENTAAAFDERRNVVVLFGGLDATSSALDETWEYDGTTWTNRTTSAPHPAKQVGAAMTFDVIGNRIVLFTTTGETWTYDDGVWTLLSLAHSPSPRALASFVSDRSINHTLLFGGSTDAGTKSDIWSLEGDDWKQIDVAGDTPPGRFFSGLAVLASEHAVVLFGGYSGQASLGDTWIFRFK